MLIFAETRLRQGYAEAGPSSLKLRRGKRQKTKRPHPEVDTIQYIDFARKAWLVYLDRRLSDQDKRNKLCDLCVFAVKYFYDLWINSSK